MLVPINGSTLVGTNRKTKSERWTQHTTIKERKAIESIKEPQAQLGSNDGANKVEVV